MEEIGAGRPALRWEVPEIIYFSYLGIILLLLLIPGVILGQHPRPWPLILLHVTLAAIGFILRRAPLVCNHPFTWLLRWWYPVIFLVFCFEAIGEMIHIVQPEFLDPVMTAADRALFGRMLTPWMQQAASPWLTELMYFCYTSFYIFIPGVGIPLYLRWRRDRTETARLAFRQFLTAVVLLFYVCYLHFLLTPVGGPVFFEGYPGPVLKLAGGPITRFEQWLFGHGTIVGGAFPSSHVAVAIVVAAFAVRFRVARWFWAPLSVGLALSTIYNGYHYGVDVIYGMVV
ncbi:phosphatase PAP2 family protein, partial [Candidatus Zixiibacteriota bacterium]